MKQIILSIEVDEISTRAIRQWLSRLRIDDFKVSGICVKDIYVADGGNEIKDVLEREGLKII